MKIQIKNKLRGEGVLFICALFLIGAAFGWVFELLVRRIESGVWGNAGMLRGPYLPVYGFGFITLYCLAELPFSERSKGVTTVVKIICMGMALTLLEYVGGLIFVRGLGLPLWDYSYAWGNVQGLICPLCSLVWTGFSGIYLLFLHTPIKRMQGEFKTSKAARVLVSMGVLTVFLDFLLTVFA